MSHVPEACAVILGGGRGTRLYPLTKLRSKPAVPIAGQYRLIDIPLSNCINSGIFRISVLTQYSSVSLHRHIAQTYHFDAFHPGWVQILAAEQTLHSADWYQGTADAVRKQLAEIEATGASYVLILAGDHIYRMDYERMVEFHAEVDADITVAVQPVARDDAHRFGLLRREQTGQLVSFAEKPSDPDVLKEFVAREDPEFPFIGSMGIYLFKTEALSELLAGTDYDDFGGEVIPTALDAKNVYGFDFEGYWEDVGTIRSYYDASLAMTKIDSPFNFYDPKRPIYTHARFLPASIVEDSELNDVLLSNGCRVRRCNIRQSIVGLRSQIRDGVSVNRAVLMGADYYEPPNGLGENEDVPLGIGPGSHIEGAIIDKNPRIGENVVIRPFPEGTNQQTARYHIIDGIVVIPKNTTLPSGYRIAPD